MPTVFISHASADDARITALHDALEAATKLDLWVDHRDLEAGDDWQAEIDSALRACPYVIVVLSAAALASREVTAEWRYALGCGKRLLVVLLEDLPLANIPYRLHTIQWVKLHADWDGGVAALSRAVLRAHGRADGPADDTAPAFSHWPVTARPPIDRRLTDIPLSGRDADLTTLLRLLRDYPVAILGVGGLGKSRLAAEALLRAEGVGGAIWHVASATSSDEALLELVREHFDLPALTPGRDVFSRLKAEPRLIVIDNAEDVADPARRAAYARLIDELLAAKAQVLLTSRVEWREVARLHTLAPEPLPPDPAEQIVRSMAEALDLPEKTRPKVAAQAAAIAGAARRHPRLIEWAVGQMKRLPVEAVLGDLRALKSRDAQAALDEMLRKTLDQMRAAHGDSPLTALRRLAVCRGGFSYAAAEKLLEPVQGEGWPDDLTRLQEWLFVRYDGERYAIDPLVIEAVGEDDSARRPHYDFYRALAWEHDDKQDYLGLDPESANLEAAFEWAMRTEHFADAFWLYNGVSDFLPNRGRFGQRRAWLERAAAAILPSPDSTVPPADPRLVAAVQNSLGILYAQHPLGDRLNNLRKAIAAYEAALVFYTPEAAPLAYARTQNNLGEAYRALAKVADRADNLRKAIAAYEAALVYHTPEAAPLAYATTQNNLGLAYADLAAVADRAANLHKAVAAYEAALVFYTPQAAPLAYAMTQNNLGNAYADLAGVEDRADNLRKAVAAYEAAPLAYAATQNNLGIAYADLAAVADRADNLHKAVAAYEAALVYHTPEAAPLAYAATQGNLGIALEDSDDLAGALACWRRAEPVYRAMGAAERADTLAGWIADAEARLDPPPP